jgi:hypothetical protein
MTENFRALCEKLVAIEDALSGGSVQFSNQGQALDGYSALAAFRDVADRARSALAEQPVGPTDEKLRELYDEMRREPGGGRSYWAFLLDFARAVLARWGQP